MITKVVRLPLIIREQDYEKTNKLLWDLQRQVRSVKNRTIQLEWEWSNLSHEYDQNDGIIRRVSETLPNHTLRGNIYALFASENNGTMMYSSNLSVSINNSERDFKNSAIEVLNGNKSIIEYKKNQPIELHNDAIQLQTCGNSYNIDIKLFSKKFAAESGRGTTSVVFSVQRLKEYQSAILKRCVSGEYKIAESRLIYDKKKRQWFLNLAYKFENQAQLPDRSKIMGVDLGIACVAYMSFNFCEDRYYIPGGEITSFRHQVERRKKDLQKQGKFCGEGRIGHGIETRTKPLEKLNEIISNYRNTTNHKYSRYIVDIAFKHGCGTIQMEDLKNVSGDNLFLKEWTYFDLRTKIEYKAAEKGIAVVFIDPKYTSQRCSRCGCINSENRPKEKMGQAYFKCVECGYMENADYNASRNIAQKDIEKMISRKNENPE